MSVLQLQPDVIYGPIQSRRLGRSLGINLMPPARKACTFDCVYCQYGSAGPGSAGDEKGAFPDVETVLRRVEQAIGEHSRLDYLTFSGNGEPTLHPGFPEVVREVRRIRDRLCPHVRLALLSNSSQARRREIREALEQVDDPIMKLDAGDPLTLAEINRPATGVNFEDIIDGLRAMHRVIIQSMFIAGPVQNAEGEAHQAWLTAIAQLRPEKVQIYSLDRPAPATGAQRVASEVLQGLAREAKARTGIDVTAY